MNDKVHVVEDKETGVVTIWRDDEAEVHPSGYTYPIETEAERDEVYRRAIEEALDNLN